MKKYKIIDNLDGVEYDIIAHGASCAFEIAKLQTKHNDMLVCDMNYNPIPNWREEVAV